MMQHVSPAPAVTMMATQSVPPPSYQESQQVSGFTRVYLLLVIQLVISYSARASTLMHIEVLSPPQFLTIDEGKNIFYQN